MLLIKNKKWLVKMLKTFNIKQVELQKYNEYFHFVFTFLKD